MKESHYKKVSKAIILVAILILAGCSTSKTPLIIVAKTNKNSYGKKYSYVIEEKKSFSSPHGSPFPKTYIMHFYIYTDNIEGEVQGDKILWGVGNSLPKQLSQNSTFVFDAKSIAIDGLLNCDPSGICFLSDLNGKHKLVPISKLKDLETDKENVYLDFTYK